MLPFTSGTEFVAGTDMVRNGLVFGAWVAVLTIAGYLVFERRMPDASTTRRDLDLFIAVAIGGVIGASARYGIDLLLPTATDQWPLATFLINLTGAFILGMVIEAATAFAPDPGASAFARRLRPFLVTGVLGGYTTFSSYMVETHQLMLAGRVPLAMLYLFGSLLACLLCCPGNGARASAIRP